MQFKNDFCEIPKIVLLDLVYIKTFFIHFMYLQYYCTIIIREGPNIR